MKTSKSLPSVLSICIACLITAAPAVSAVTLSLDNYGYGDGWIAIKYSSTGPLPRAFALNVSVSAGVIDNYDTTGCQPYRIYMGSIVIENGQITDYASPIAPAAAPDSPGQIGTSSIVLEMGSLYDPANPGSAKPAPSGTLIKLHCSACWTDVVMTVTSNALRGKIVLEDGTVEDRTVSMQVCYHCDCCDGTPEDCAEAVSVGCPTSWCNPYQCHGDADGALFAGKRVYGPDLNILVQGWGKVDATLWLAADFDHRAFAGRRVFGPDLNILIYYWNDAHVPPADCLNPNRVYP